MKLYLGRMQIRTKGSFLLLIAFCGIAFSSCTQRRYAGRTIRIGGKQETLVTDHSKTEVRKDAAESTPLNGSSDQGSPVMLEKEIEGNSDLNTASVADQTVKKRVLAVLIPLNKQLLRGSPLQTIVEIRKSSPVIKENEQRLLKEPGDVMEDALLTAVAILLLIVVFGGIFLLLNHWFLHLSSKQILNGLLALAVAVFIILLLTLD